MTHLVGLQRSGTKYSLEPDRGKAVAFALRQAAPGDIVLLAGKGHEKVQVTSEGEIPFDDVEVAGEQVRICSSDTPLLTSSSFTDFALSAER